MLRFTLALAAAVLTLAAAAPSGLLYGLALVSNSPATFGLVGVGANGSTAVLGPAHTELFGCGDLVAVAQGMLYYLGDTAQGTTLVALNLTTGAKVCSLPVDVVEVGYVGLGQSLDYDDSSDTLVLSGVNVNKTAHVVYRSSAPIATTPCGQFTRVGTFGDSDYLPMLHSSALDATGQRLFVTMITNGANGANGAGGAQGPGGIGVIDISGKGKPMVVITEGVPDPIDAFISMHWDEGGARHSDHSDHSNDSNSSGGDSGGGGGGGRLVGIWLNEGGQGSGSAQGIMLHALNPATQKWAAPKAVTGVPTAWNTVTGNAATASTFDEKGRNIYLVAGTQDPSSGNVVARYLAAVNVDDGSLGAHPKMAAVGLGGSGLEALTMGR